MDDNPDGCLDDEYHGSDHQERQPVEDSAWIAGGLSDGLLECFDKELKFGDYPDADYQIVITVKSITTNGFMTCDALLKNKQGTVFFNVENLKGNSDSFFTPGTKLARIKIWAALTGGALGKMMKSRL